MNRDRPSCARAAARCAAVLALAACATGGILARTAGQPGVFRGRIDLVNLGVTVTDRKAGLVTDLRAEDFQVLEDGRPQTIQYFAKGDLEAAPELHLGVLLDVSGSMADDIAFMRTASIKFLNTLTDAVDITLVDFDAEVRVTRYRQDNFARLVERIRQQKLGTHTAMYDAIGVYLDGATEQDGRKVMLLYTDGGDTRSVLRLREVIDLLKASDVTLYAIGAFDHRSTMRLAEQRMVLHSMAEATGGQPYFPMSVKELDKVYAQIQAEIRAQYTLGYVSTNEKSDGAWRKVEIRVAKPGAEGLRVRSRQGYYAPYRK